MRPPASEKASQTGPLYSFALGICNFVSLLTLAACLLLPIHAARSRTLENLPSRVLSISELPTVELIDLIGKERYEGATALADSCIRALPSDPGGYFFKLTVINNMSIDFEEDSYYPDLYAYADTVEALCKDRIAKGDSSAILRFYIGSSIGFRTITLLHQQELIEGFKSASRSAEWLEASVKIDTTYYDSYTGLGNYYYVKSAYSGLLRSIGLVSDQRNKGISCLNLAANGGIYTRLAARSSLAWVMIDREMPDSALYYADYLLQCFPHNRSFLWCRGKAQAMKEDWLGVEETYTDLLRSIRASGHNNHFNEISCLESIAKSRLKRKDWIGARAIVDEALAIPLTEKIKKQKKKALGKLQEYREEIREHLE